MENEKLNGNKTPDKKDLEIEEFLEQKEIENAALLKILQFVQGEQNTQQDKEQP